MQPYDTAGNTQAYDTGDLQALGFPTQLYVNPCSTEDLDTNGVPDVCPSASNYIAGSPGNDSLSGTNQVDCIFGFGGDDADLLDGGNGNDHVLMGGAGDDTIYGGLGSDVLNGESGDDWLSGGAGTDTLHGGSGIDTCVEEVPGTSERLTGCELVVP